MHPTKIQNYTRVFVEPTNFQPKGECGDLYIEDTVTQYGLPIMYSAWLPSPEDVTAILLGAPVILGIVGTVHPVVQVFTGEPTESIPEPSLPTVPLTAEPVPECPECHLKLQGAMGYVCPSMQCPIQHKVTC